MPSSGSSSEVDDLPAPPAVSRWYRASIGKAPLAPATSARPNQGGSAGRPRARLMGEAAHRLGQRPEAQRSA